MSTTPRNFVRSFLEAFKVDIDYGTFLDEGLQNLDKIGMILEERILESLFKFMPCYPIITIRIHGLESPLQDFLFVFILPKWFGEKSRIFA